MKFRNKKIIALAVIVAGLLGSAGFAHAFNYDSLQQIFRVGGALRVGGQTADGTNAFVRVGDAAGLAALNATELANMSGLYVAGSVIMLNARTIQNLAGDLLFRIVDGKAVARLKRIIGSARLVLAAPTGNDLLFKSLSSGNPLHLRLARPAIVNRSLAVQTPCRPEFDAPCVTARENELSAREVWADQVSGPGGGTLTVQASADGLDFSTTPILAQDSELQIRRGNGAVETFCFQRLVTYRQDPADASLDEYGLKDGIQSVAGPVPTMNTDFRVNIAGGTGNRTGNGGHGLCMEAYPLDFTMTDMTVDNQNRLAVTGVLLCCYGD